MHIYCCFFCISSFMSTAEGQHSLRALVCLFICDSESAHLAAIALRLQHEQPSHNKLKVVDFDVKASLSNKSTCTLAGYSYMQPLFYRDMVGLIADSACYKEQFCLGRLFPLHCTYLQIELTLCQLAQNDTFLKLKLFGSFFKLSLFATHTFLLDSSYMAICRNQFNQFVCSCITYFYLTHLTEFGDLLQPLEKEALVCKSTTTTRTWLEACYHVVFVALHLQTHMHAVSFIPYSSATPQA